MFDEPWLEVLPLVNSPDPLLQAELDKGEAEVIALAIERDADRIIIDERKGRRIASMIYGLRIVGTGGILLRAKWAGLLDAVRPAMHEIRKNGYYLSENLVQEICKAAGE